VRGENTPSVSTLLDRYTQALDSTESFIEFYETVSEYSHYIPGRLPSRLLKKADFESLFSFSHTVSGKACGHYSYLPVFQFFFEPFFRSVSSLPQNLSMSPSPNALFATDYTPTPLSTSADRSSSGPQTLPEPGPRPS